MWSDTHLRTPRSRTRPIGSALRGCFPQAGAVQLFCQVLSSENLQDFEAGSQSAARSRLRRISSARHGPPRATGGPWLKAGGVSAGGRRDQQVVPLASIATVNALTARSEMDRSMSPAVAGPAVYEMGKPGTFPHRHSSWLASSVFRQSFRPCAHASSDLFR